MLGWARYMSKTSIGWFDRSWYVKDPTFKVQHFRSQHYFGVDCHHVSLKRHHRRITWWQNQLCKQSMAPDCTAWATGCNTISKRYIFYTEDQKHCCGRTGVTGCKNKLDKHVWDRMSRNGFCAGHQNVKYAWSVKLDLEKSCPWILNSALDIEILAAAQIWHWDCSLNVNPSCELDYQKSFKKARQHLHIFRLEFAVKIPCANLRETHWMPSHKQDMTLHWWKAENSLWTA